MANFPSSKIRNVAIIAHVDHGKTTLVDAFLKQSNIFRANQGEMQQEQILDSGDLERERGITIFAKNASISYKDYKINIIDTPGHADFGGEVERTLNMADGCLLVVDAQEGPMPQTRFVLKKAFELGLTPIVVINEIDKQFADPKRTLSRVQDLFLTLATTEEQLDFPVYYAIGRTGKVFTEMPADINAAADVTPLLEAIVNKLPAPQGDETGPLQMQVCSLEYDNHLGRLLVGKIKRGTLQNGTPVVVMHDDSANSAKDQGRVKNIFVRNGLAYVPVESAGIGEIVAVAGIESKAIGGTLCTLDKPEALPTIKISSPAVEIKFEANTSPFLGREGKFVTAKQIQQRLDREAETNISLRITKADGGAYFVAGRGELQLSILIETMRREGYEFQIRKPNVVFIQDGDTQKEPLEELVIDVPEEYQGAVNSALSQRRAELVSMESEHGSLRFTYKILTRNLLGLRNQLVLATKGNVVINNFLIDYVPVTEQPELYRKGVLIASETGTAAAYALNSVQERGELFVLPSTEVYEGMLVGVNKYDNDMEVNVCKERAKSGVRRNAAEITQIALKPIIPLTLDFALVFLANDEILEVTPENLRLRKQYLKHHEREWAKRENLTDFAKQQLGMK